MNRNDATKLARNLLDKHGLSDYGVRLVTDINANFLGKCDYNHKCIYLNAHHIDQHHEKLVTDTILHEIAHALTPNHQHDATWIAKASEIGCIDLSACASFGLDAAAIDAIRSGHVVEVSFEMVDVKSTITTQELKPKHTIHKLQDLCPTCGKVAKEIAQIVTVEKVRNYVCTNKIHDRHLFKSLVGKPANCNICNKPTILLADEKIIEKDVQLTMLNCGHVIRKIIPKATPYGEFITQGKGDLKCKHEWTNIDRPTECVNCGAFKLYPFQVEGSQAIEKGLALNRGFALFDDVGLGKTVQPLPVLFYHSKERMPYLLVGKAGPKYQYLKEFVNWLGPAHFPQVINTAKDALIPGLSGYIISYAALRKFDLNKFVEIGIKTIILDECQAISNPDASQTQAVRELIKLTDAKVIPTSATPWKNRGTELFVALNILDPKKFYSFEDFKRIHVDTYTENNKTKIGGIKNPTRFKEFIKHICIRREAEIVMPQLPKTNRTKYYCKVPDHAKFALQSEVNNLVKMYNEAVIGGEDPNSFKNNAKIMQSLMRMRQIVGVAKVPATIEAAEKFLEESDKKLVIFLHHKECAAMVEEQLKTLFKEYDDAPKLLVLLAKNDSMERTRIQDEFNNSKRAFMIASTLASGEALNLQTGSDCIMMERQWNPANEEQAEGRFKRIGQMSKHINAIYVEAEDSIDSHLDRIVHRKRIQFRKVMNHEFLADNDMLPCSICASTRAEHDIKWNEGSIITELVQSIVASHNKKKAA